MELDITSPIDLLLKYFRLDLLLFILTDQFDTLLIAEHYIFRQEWSIL